MNNNKGNGFGAFLVGGLIGGAIGLLYAPRSGEETRRILADEGQVMVNKALSSIQEAQETALSAIKTTQARMEALNQETKERLGKLQEIAENTLHEQKQSLKKGYSNAKKAVKDTGELPTAS